MTKQAIIYTRFSPRPNADECKSCDKQEERCFAYATTLGYQVSDGFRDEATSGSALNRPGLVEAIGHLGPGWVLVVDSSDRLARDMLVNLTIRQQVADAGATIEYADGSPNGASPESVLFQNILAAFSAYERDRIRLRTKSGLKRKRENSERTTGHIPIGWMLDPENPRMLVRQTTERWAIVRMCGLSHGGITSGEIAPLLDLEYGPCRGKPWSPRTIRKMIQKHSYWAAPDGDLGLEPSHP